MNKTTIIRSLVLAGLLVLLVIPAGSAKAADTSKFKAGDIISNTIMTDYQSMSVYQIQKFMDAKIGNNCDVWGKEMYNATYTRAQIGDMYNQPPPYTCLNKYTQNGLTSAQIVYNAAQTYHINPKALLVTLQKEQGLLTNEWPWPNLEYKSATGYGCPDGADCNSQYYGFTNQVTNTAKMYHAIAIDDPNWYTPYLLGNNNIYWDPSRGSFLNTSGNPPSNHPDTCGYSVVNIQNRATQALYNYTPYRPNPAALQAGYGNGDRCSAYGNRNFWLYFTDWFGSTYAYVVQGVIADKYNQLGGSSGVLGKITSDEIDTPDGGIHQLFQNGRIYWTSSTGAWSTRGGIGSKYVSLGAEKSLLGYPTSDENDTSDGGKYEQFQNGRIYWTSGLPAYPVHGAIGDKYLALGAEKSLLGYPTSDEMTVNGGKYQQYQRGRIYWTGGSTTWIVRGAIEGHYVWGGADKSVIGLPTGNEMSLNGKNGDVYQQYQRGRIYWSSTTGAATTHGAIQSHYLSVGANTSFLGLPTSDEMDANSNGRYQLFQNGRIYWTSGTGAWSTHGGIGGKYVSLGAEKSYLGYPTSDENNTNDGGKYEQFQGGRIYWTSGLPASSVHGAIGNKYLSLGAEKSSLGYPTGEEVSVSGGKYQQYQMGRIYWTGGSTTWVVSGDIAAKYSALDADKGYLGLPSSDANSTSDGGLSQAFDRGWIYWSSTTNAWSLHGAIGNKYKSLGAEKSSLGYPTSDEIPVSDGVYQQFQSGKIHWNSSTGETLVTS